MPRPTGSKDSAPRQRTKMTAGQKALRAQKKASAAEKRRVSHAAAEKAKRAAFIEQLRGTRSSPRRAAGSSSAAAADGDDEDDNDDEDDAPSDSESNDGAGNVMDVDSEDELRDGTSDAAEAASAGDGVEPPPPPPPHRRDDIEAEANDNPPPPPPRRPREHRPADVEAELDDDEQLDGADASGGVMATYLAAVFRRLHAEVRGDVAKHAREPKWLLAMLKAEGADWWLPAGRAPTVCNRLGLEYGEPSYYRGIYVWLPDVRWGVEAMPPCPTCESAVEVAPHDFQPNHCGRRVCALTTNYFTITQRYICGCCSRAAKKAKEDAAAAAAAAGLRVEAAPAPQYTFMGYDARSRLHMPFGHGSEYPAFHTYKGAVDSAIIDLMRPLSSKGLRPTALSATLLELHAKQYTRDYLKREHMIERDQKLGTVGASEPAMFSEFGDKTKYAGLVPTGSYLAHVLKLHAASIKEHLDKEVKKRGADRLHWDACVLWSRTPDLWILLLHCCLLSCSPALLLS